MKLAALNIERVLSKIMHPVYRSYFNLISQDYLQTKLKESTRTRKSKFFPEGFPGLSNSPDLGDQSTLDKQASLGLNAQDPLMATVSSHLSNESVEDFSASNNTLVKNPSPASKFSKKQKDTTSISNLG